MSGFLSSRQAGERLEVSERTVARWCQDGLVPGAFKIGRAWLIPEEALPQIERPTLGRPLRESRGTYGGENQGEQA
jgi:excisionase family DNA binding protein